MVPKGGRKGKGEGGNGKEREREKGRIRGAFRQIKICDYTPVWNLVKLTVFHKVMTKIGSI